MYEVYDSVNNKDNIICRRMNINILKGIWQEISDKIEGTIVMILSAIVLYLLREIK